MAWGAKWAILGRAWLCSGRSRAPRWRFGGILARFSSVQGQPGPRKCTFFHRFFYVFAESALSLLGTLLGSSWAPFGWSWGALGCLLGVFWAFLGGSWALLGRSWAPPGRVLGALGRVLGALGQVLGTFGPFLAGPGRFRGALGRVFGRSWALLVPVFGRSTTRNSARNPFFVHALSFTHQQRGGTCAAPGISLKSVNCLAPGRPPAAAEPESVSFLKQFN